MERLKKYPHAICIVTLRCNLKCKNCILCVPYYKKPSHPSLDYLKQTVDRAFLLGDYEIFEYNGGEPLLRKDFADIWEYNKRYIGRADVFKTVTNGSLPISDDLIAVWKGYGEKVYIIVDDYGMELSPNARNCVDKLQENCIPCELRDMWSENRHHGGWVDFLAPEKPFRDIDGAKETYLRCGQAQKLKNCCNIIDGLLFPCHMQFQLNDRHIVPAENFPEQGIDLFDDSESFEIKRDKMDTYTDVTRLPYLESCRYCQCLAAETPRLKPAEQLNAAAELPFRI